MSNVLVKMIDIAIERLKEIKVYQKENPDTVWKSDILLGYPEFGIKLTIDKKETERMKKGLRARE